MSGKSVSFGDKKNIFFCEKKKMFKKDDIDVDKKY